MSDSDWSVMMSCLWLLYNRGPDLESGEDDDDDGGSDSSRRGGGGGEGGGGEGGSSVVKKTAQQLAGEAVLSRLVASVDGAGFTFQ